MGKEGERMRYGGRVHALQGMHACPQSLSPPKRVACMPPPEVQHKTNQSTNHRRKIASYCGVSLSQPKCLNEIKKLIEKKGSIILFNLL